MNRSTLFAAAIAAAIICLIIAVTYYVGGPLGTHKKHALLFFVLAIVAGLFAAVNRPQRAAV